MTSSPSLRRHWALHPDITFLNHGSFGACPREIQALQAELRQAMEAEPIQFLVRHAAERLDPSRRALAAFLGAQPEDLVFVTNATTGVNAVVRSLDFQPGDEILTTSFDYNACRNVLTEAARRSGARVVVAELPFPLTDAEEIVSAVLASVTPRTRLAMLDHVSSDTAIVLPVERLVRALEARGVDTLIDGAHAPGMVPLDLTALRPAYYTGNLHKWVCAPKGAAFLWAREDRQDGIQPAVISHGNNRPRPGYPAWQDRFDWAGTADPSPWICVGAALEFMGRLLPGGWPALQAANHALVCQARARLCERLGLSAPCPESLLGSLATLPLPGKFQGAPPPPPGGMDPDQCRLYDEFRIEVPFIRRADASRWFRISAQAYLSMADYERLADVLEAF